jgi:O-antigen/teichoic acid export membrane protein
VTRTGRVVWGIATNYVFTAISAVAGFLVVPVVLGFVGREGYGLWATVGQLLAYLTLLDFGVGSAVIRRTAELRGRETATRDLSRALSTATALFCVLGLAFLAAGLLLRELLPRALSLPPDRQQLATAIFTVMVVYGAVSFPLRIALKALYGAQQMALVNLMTLLENLLTPLLAVALLFAGIGLMALPWGSVAASCLAALTGMILLHRTVPGLAIAWRNVSRDEAGELFRWSWLLWLNSLAVIVIYQTDAIVVTRGQGLAAAAVYALTSRLPLYALPLIFALADACLPGAVELCAQKRIDRLREVYLRMLRVTAAVAMLVAVVAVACNEAFVSLWVQRQNYGGFALTIVFAVILFYRVHMHAASVVVIGTGRIRGVVIASLVEAALNLVLSLWWVQRYGIVGVAAGTAVAGLVTSGWFVVGVVCRELQLGIRDYLWRGVGIPLISAIPAAGVAIVFSRAGVLSGWPGLVITAASITVAYAMAFAVVGISRRERQEIFGWLEGPRNRLAMRFFASPPQSTL